MQEGAAKHNTPLLFKQSKIDYPCRTMLVCLIELLAAHSVTKMCAICQLPMYVLCQHIRCWQPLDAQ